MLKKKTSKVLRLVESFRSADTIAALEDLLARARAGEIVGLVYAAIEPQRSYVADTAGEATRDLTYALGMVRVLDKLIASRIRGLGQRT